MYKIFTDKQKTFKCNIDISGASLNDCHARLIMETADGNFFYKGKVDSNGNCSVDIPKIKLINEGISGKIKLEVIVENTIFNTWESEFMVATSKKVNVQVEDDEDSDIKVNESNDDKMKVNVQVEDEDEDEEYIEEIKPDPIKEEDYDFKKDYKKESLSDENKENEKLDIFNFQDFLEKKIII